MPKASWCQGLAIELVIFVTQQQAAGKSMDANEKRNPRKTLHGSIQMQWMGLMYSLRIQREKLTIESPPIEEAQHSDDDWDDSDSNSDSLFQSFSLEHEDKENNEFGAAPVERGI